MLNVKEAFLTGYLSKSENMKKKNTLSNQAQSSELSPLVAPLNVLTEPKNGRQQKEGKG